MALLTSVPPLGTGGGGTAITIGTAPGMFDTGAERPDGRVPPAFTFNPGGVARGAMVGAVVADGAICGGGIDDA